jgi:hypothetical protein
MNIITSILTETFQTLVLILICAFVCILIGYIFGRRANIAPVKKTRYFVDNENTLRRWKYGKSKTEVTGNWQNGWTNSSFRLNYLMENMQEIDPLTARRMFPMAFQKPRILTKEEFYEAVA